MIVNPASIPLRIASEEDLGRIRAFLRQAAFDDQTLCRALELENMSALGRVDWGKAESKVMPEVLRWCIQVFARGRPTEERAAAEVCGTEVLAAFLKTGLLRPAKKSPAALVCPVWLYPLDGFLIVSDRCDDPDGESYVPAADVVFPAIYAGTLRFLKLIPPANDCEALDLCGGSGIGALQLSRTARVAATADLAERSAVFAGFNARLNGVPIESFCGDLYEPVRGRQFDVISAHPPFVPATGQNMVYRDGGDSGEEVTRQVVEGLPVHLRRGGTCIILCVARDTEKKTFEQRAHEWLGDGRSEFDVVFGLEKVLSVGEVIESIRKRGQNVGELEAQQLSARLQSLGTRQFVYGALFIRRYAGPVVSSPTRIHITPQAGAADFERVLAWRQECRQPGFFERLAKSRPRLAPQLQLIVRHVVRDGALVPAEFTFEIENGVQAALRPDGWVVPLLARLEGNRTVAEVFETARAGDELPAGFGLEDFAGLVRGMIERGFMAADVPAKIN